MRNKTVQMVLLLVGLLAIIFIAPPVEDAEANIVCPPGTIGPPNPTDISQCEPIIPPQTPGGSDPIDGSPPSVPAPPPSGDPLSDPNAVGDPDDDGVPNLLDNCPNDPNPDQLDTYGGPAGDACEPPTAARNGVTVFQALNVINIYGDCSPAPMLGPDKTMCQLVAQFDPTDTELASLNVLSAPPGSRFVRIEFPPNNDWYVDVHFIRRIFPTPGEPPVTIYQINVYDGFGNLITDNFIILVNQDGTFTVAER